MNVNGLVKDKHYMLRRLSVWFCISKRDWMSIKANFLIHKKIMIFCSILLSAKLSSMAKFSEGKYRCRQSI